MHICVLGAGITGLAAAYSLQQEGHQVTLLDAAEAVGQGASGGNGAQLSYSYVQPLAEPSIWGQLPKLLLAADSPLKFRLQADLHQWAWGLSFMAACNRVRSERSTATLLGLAARSREGFEQMLNDLRPDCDHSTPGKLVLYPTEAGLQAAARQIELQARLGGAPQRLVSPAECVALEPALASYQPAMAGAVYTPSESAADCLKVCQALDQALAQRGAQRLYGRAVTRLEVAGGRVQAAHTAQGPVQADHFVLALGADSVALSRPLGLQLPVYPLKGYSITLPVGTEPGQAPRVSVTDSTRKVVFARLGERLRVAGMVELVGYGRDIPPDRISSLCQSTAQVFPGVKDFSEVQAWCGLRPATPTGLPIVGRLPQGPDNLWMNTGHGALGFTLAFGTARQLSEALRA